MTASATSASTPTWPRMARCAGMLTLTAASAIYIPHAHATGSSFAPTEVVQGTPLVLQGSSTATAPSSRCMTWRCTCHARYRL